MKLPFTTYSLHFPVLILFATIASQADSVLAQASNIVPDNTLGDESSQVVENFDNQLFFLQMDKEK